jgi:DNA-binding FadR family transcriptional regulator
MRLINEPYCAELASERASSDDISGMRELLSAVGPLIRARDREKLMTLDRAFHYRISVAACNSILAGIMTMLHERSLRFWFISFSDDLHLRRIDDEHRDILDAIVQRDRQGAAAAMRAHIESSRKHVTRAI